MRAVYIAHPFGSDPSGNVDRVRVVAHRVALKEQLPLAPQPYLPEFLSDKRERDLALRMCLRLVGFADELRVYGEPTEGMRLEIAEAKRLGIPVVNVEKS